MFGYIARICLVRLFFLIIIFSLLFACTPVGDSMQEAGQMVTQAQPIMTQEPKSTEVVLSPVVDLTLPKITSTASPTVTLIPEYMIYDADVKRVQFSIQNANRTIPADIISEIAYSEGGGGGCECGQVYWDTKSSIPIAACYKNVYQQVETVRVEFCGYGPDERVQFYVEDPTGEKIELDAQGPAESYSVDFITTLDTVVGDYIISALGENSLTEAAFRIVDPVGPKLRLLNDGQLYAYNFEPFEKLRLFYYGEDLGISPTGDYFSAGFTAWDEYSVDQNGALLIDLNFVDWKAKRFYVIGLRGDDVIDYGKKRNTEDS